MATRHPAEWPDMRPTRVPRRSSRPTAAVSRAQAPPVWRSGGRPVWVERSPMSVGTRSRRPRRVVPMIEAVRHGTALTETCVVEEPGGVHPLIRQRLRECITEPCGFILLDVVALAVTRLDSSIDESPLLLDSVLRKQGLVRWTPPVEARGSTSWCDQLSMRCLSAAFGAPAIDIKGLWTPSSVRHSRFPFDA